MTSATNDKCPVCGWDNAATARTVQVGKTSVRVCCDECERELAANPAKYASK
jgi:hypothetical protein